MRQASINIQRVLLVVALSGMSFAVQMAVIKGTSLSGHEITLPAAAEGHVAVLCIGFSHASENQIRPWVTRIRNMSRPNPVELYQVAELQDAPRFVRGMIIHGMKSGIPPAEHDHFVVLYNGEKELKDAVGFNRGDDAYVLLLNRNGAVQWKTHGEVNDQAASELATQIKALELNP
jgi:hypothetical protein